MLSFYKLGLKFSLGGTNDPHVSYIVGKVGVY